MLRDDHENENNEYGRLIHAPEEEFNDSQEHSVFGTFYQNQRHPHDSEDDNNFMISRNQDELSDLDDLNNETVYGLQNSQQQDSDDDAVKRPLFLSFKANDSAESVSDALREQNNEDPYATEQPEPEEELPRPSMLDTMYAKEDYLSNVPKYEADTSWKMRSTPVWKVMNSLLSPRSSRLLHNRLLKLRLRK